MNFNLVLKYLLELFNKNNIPYILIGGLALDIHGIIRTTQDVDFIVPLEDIQKIEDFLLAHGYKKLFRNDDVANYASDNSELGRVDFIMAHRKYTQNMLKNAISFDTKLSPHKLKVARLEDLIGLKLQAYFNRKDRKVDDIKDIENIIRQFKSKLDYDKIKEYFSIFNAQDLLKKLWKVK